MPNKKNRAHNVFHLSCSQFWTGFGLQDLLNQVCFQCILLPCNFTVYPGGSVNFLHCLSNYFLCSRSGLSTFHLMPQLFYWKRQCVISPYLLFLLVWFYSLLLSLSLFARYKSFEDAKPVCFFSYRKSPMSVTILTNKLWTFYCLIIIYYFLSYFYVEDLNSIIIIIILFSSLCLS